jgi:ArsR family transcriptional regulator, cadmium/lead-responsive transcriptional repressor
MKNSTYHIFFNNLANKLKIDIILSLREKEKSVSELIKDLNVEQSKVSHSLLSLKNCNIVNFKQKGKQRIYFLNKQTILPMLKLIDKHSKIHCNGNCKFCKREK